MKRHRCFIAGIIAAVIAAIILPCVFWALTRDCLNPDVLIPAVVQVILAEIGIAYVISTLLMWRTLTVQLKSTSRHTLAGLSNEHNWRLLTFRDDDNRPPTLPTALPSWRGLGVEEWRWRVLHLEHLNSIRLVWEDLQDGIFSEGEIEEWVAKAKFIFQDMRSNTAEFQTGREQLRQIMRREEGYSDSFRAWLLDKDILSDDLVPDNPRNR